MTDRPSVIESALSIRPCLKGLLDVEASEHMSQQLDKLLLRFCAGEAVENDIWNLLTDIKATRVWVTEFQQPVRVHKGAQSMAGDPSNISAPVFKCPNCDYTWSRYRIGADTPRCEEHNVLLEPV